MNNEVPTFLAAIHPGDDQALWFSPDISDDVSGLALADWTAEVRLCKGRVPLGSKIRNPSITAPFTYYPGVTPTPNRFKAHLTSEMTAAMGLFPGPWTMEYWRTNPGFKSVVARYELKVNPTVLPTTTTTTTTS